MHDLEKIVTLAIDCGFQIHKNFGPGLLETVYQVVLATVHSDNGLNVERQKLVPIVYRGVAVAGAFRADLIVDDRLVIEIKSIEQNAPVHSKQLLTYRWLMNQPLGPLMNFGCATFREGLKRVVNGYQPFAPSRLRVNQIPSAIE